MYVVNLINGSGGAVTNGTLTTTSTSSASLILPSKSLLTFTIQFAGYAILESEPVAYFLNNNGTGIALDVYYSFITSMNNSCYLSPSILSFPKTISTYTIQNSTGYYYN
jgi:hypothetical protein